jgi:hypothetical protein
VSLSFPLHLLFLSRPLPKEEEPDHNRLPYPVTAQADILPAEGADTRERFKPVRTRAMRQGVAMAEKRAGAGGKVGVS